MRVPTLDGGYLPWIGGTYPGWGYAPPPRQSNTASTCYAAGGMPLAFIHAGGLSYSI